MNSQSFIFDLAPGRMRTLVSRSLLLNGVLGLILVAYCTANLGPSEWSNESRLGKRVLTSDVRIEKKTAALEHISDRELGHMVLEILNELAKRRRLENAGAGMISSVLTSLVPTELLGFGVSDDYCTCQYGIPDASLMT